MIIAKLHLYANSASFKIGACNFTNEIVTISILTRNMNKALGIDPGNQ